jgi:hypothetical protein
VGCNKMGVIKLVSTFELTSRPYHPLLGAGDRVRFIQRT